MAELRPIQSRKPPRKTKKPESATVVEFAWLAGILEGEGSFIKGPPSLPHKPQLQVAMTDRDTIERVAGLLGVSVYHVKRHNPRWKDAYGACARGRHAVEWMRKLYPMMSERRKVQILGAIYSYQDLSQRPKVSDAMLHDVAGRRVAGESWRSIQKSYPSVSHAALFKAYERVVR